MVGLVEDEQVGARRDDDRERQPPALASGEHRDLFLLRRVARKEELPEQALRLGAGEPGHRDGTVEHRTSLVELRLVL